MTLRPRAPAATAAGTLLTLLLALLTLAHTPAQAATWAAGAALPGLRGHVWSVAENPATPATVLAGTDEGVYRSEDGGLHWARTSLTTGRVWTVGFDLRAPNPAFAGTDGGGLLRSDDGGKTWTDRSGGLQSRTVRSLAFGLGAIVAGTPDGVAVSADGQSWRPSGLRGDDISAVAIAANSPSTIVIAGVDNARSGSGGTLFRSTGPTDQWDRLDLGVTSAVVSSITASALPPPPAPRVLVVCTDVGLYRSNDGGGVWQRTYPTGDQTGTLTTATFSPTDPALLYVGDDAGGSGGGRLLRSTDAGLTFAPADTGLPADHEAVSIAVAPASPPLLVVALAPPGAPGRIVAETDDTAPAPQPTGPPETGTTLPSVAPVPTVSATPRAGATPPPTTSQPGRLHRFVDWPLPLAVELVTIAAALWLFLRWRRGRLHIEGPP